jgi:hypothetical protein
MYLRPVHLSRRQEILDAICAAALTLVMFYTKLSYGVVALSFLLLMLTDRLQRRWTLGALGITITAALIIELLWQSSLAYLADLRLAFEVSGGLRGTWGQILDHILVNLTEYVLLGLFAGLALYRTRSFRDFLFYGFCAVAGFLIINQNFQSWGIIMLHAGAAVAAERILRAEDRQASISEHGSWSVAAGAKLLVLALVLPTIIHSSAALGLHTVTAGMRAGTAVPLPHLEQVRVANLWTWNDYDTAIAYQDKLRDGLDILSTLDPSPERIFVLDLGNPFSMAINAPPAQGDTPWLQWDRTLSTGALVPAERLLSDVQIVMAPRSADNLDPEQDPLSQIKALYGPYIAAHFELAAQTEHWTLHRRRLPSSPQAALTGDNRP